MARKSPKKMKGCSECGAGVKPENLERHMKNIHNKDLSEDEREDVEYRENGRSKSERRKLAKQQERRKMDIVFISVVLIAIIAVALYFAIPSSNDDDGGKVVFEQATETTPVDTSSSNEGSSPPGTDDTGNDGTGGASDTDTPPPQEESVINIPVSEISTSAKFYTYNSNGVNVRYFIVKDGGGNTKVAADACDVCYDAKKGYRQSGDKMVCKNCGNQYPISQLGPKNSAGCWPSYIPHTIQGQNIVITTDDLDTKRFMFA